MALIKRRANVRSLNVSLEEDADCLFNDSVDTSLGVFVNLVQADIVLAVACV